MNDELVAAMRPRLLSVAYRMLGSVTDAEDAVQDAFLRFQSAEEVTSPEGYLLRIVTRLCIDRLRSPQRRREYVGPWLPEPVETRGMTPSVALSESLTQAFLLLLERLSADERAAFLLRTVFDYEYAEIGETLGKSEAGVRQLVSRARRRLEQGEPRFRPTPGQADSLAERFLSACRAGDVGSIEAMLTSDVEVHTDGGGKVSAARTVIAGKNRSARFLAGVFRKRWVKFEMRSVTVNGVPGLVCVDGERVMRVVSLDIRDGVRAVYITLNPDKLSRWSVAEVE